ncbi:MAG: SDR family NAD(P)-dependent oxidoreductase [Solirubrobacterales bacterium]|nr:SDR family NAD(P)-dependent oxidoreductase [Solirubrobacterales bacterium]
MELDGKRVLLSGATGGIGQAVAARLADAGAKLVLSSRRKPELTELARSLPGGARRHKVIVSDLAKAGAAAKLIDEAGDVDVLIANAALPASGLLDDLSPTEISRAMRVNLEAPILMSRELGRALATKGEGHIVLVSSLSGKVGSPRASLYNATKFGLRGFAFGFREDMHPHGVGVSIVSPGFVRDAGMFHDSGAKPPPGAGTTTPSKVAEAVDEAIRKDRVEITVAPRRMRAISEFAYRHPGLAASIQRRGGADEIAKDVAGGQTDKR